MGHAVAVRQHLRDLLPGEPLVHAQDEQRLLLRRERLAHRGEPIRGRLARGQRAGDQPVGDARVLAGRQPPHAPAEGIAPEPLRGVPRQAVGPGPEAAQPPKPRKATPEILAEVSEDVAGSGLVAQDGDEITENLWPVALERSGRSLAELPAVQAARDVILDARPFTAHAASITLSIGSWLRAAPERGLRTRR